MESSSQPSIFGGAIRRVDTLLGKLSCVLEHDFSASQLLPSRRLVALAFSVMGSLYFLGYSTSTLLITGCLQALIIAAYNPLPLGMKASARVHLVLGLIILYKRIDYIVNKMRGKKTCPWNAPSLQVPIITDKAKLPRSATFGGVKVTREEIAGVRVILYRPDNAEKPSPALVFMRGAGFVQANADLFDWTVYEIAKKTNVIAVLVDCRRAPQHPFQESFQDNLDVTRHILRHGADFDIDINCVGIAGDSAGGNYAAGVATLIATEDNELPNLKFLLLQNPTLQVFDFRLPSFQDYHNIQSFVNTIELASNYAYHMGIDEEKIEQAASIICENRHITPELRKQFADYVSVKRLPVRYQNPQRPLAPVTFTTSVNDSLAEEIARLVVDPRLSPLLAHDLSRLPPTFIHVAEFDVLRDDAFLYESRLREAGVEVELYFDEGGYHCDAVRILPGALTPPTGLKTAQAGREFIQRIVHRHKGIHKE